MMFEIRRPTNGIPDWRANWSASVSPTSFESAYEVSGRGGWLSSIGANAGGSSNGSPRTVSLDAQTIAADAAVDRGGEDVVRRHGVVAEGLAGGLDLGRGDRREMDDGIGGGA